MNSLLLLFVFLDGHVHRLDLTVQYATGLFFFFLIRGIRASLRILRLIPGLTEHPVSPVNR